MTASQTASRKSINNKPSKEVIANLDLLCEQVLEPIRRHFDRAVIISSAYRSPALNKAIGGSSSSQHTLGEAADFIVQGVDNYEVCKWMEANLNYDQLINEFPPYGWIHCSYSADRMRNQELTAVKVLRRTVYRKGIIK